MSDQPSGESTKTEKLALLALAGGALVVLAWIGLKSLGQNTVDANAATMVGVIITGLIAFMKDIVSAVRGYSMSAQLGKVTDQLAASGPVTDQPLPVEVKNSKDSPVPTEDAGDAKAIP